MRGLSMMHVIRKITLPNTIFYLTPDPRPPIVVRSNAARESTHLSGRRGRNPKQRGSDMTNVPKVPERGQATDPAPAVLWSDPAHVRAWLTQIRDGVLD